MAINLKRKHSNPTAENPREKRQKKIIDASSSKFTEPVEAKAIKTAKTKFTKPKQSVKTLVRTRETKANSKVKGLTHENTIARIRLHVTKTKTNEVITTKQDDETESPKQSFKDLIAKAKEKVQEKRQIDHRNTDITQQRIAARLAINQMVKTVDFDDHLKYHTELQELGCDFIRDQVSCLRKFSLLSRSDYFESNNSVLEDN